MSLHDDLQKKLSAEQMQQLDDILGDEFDWDLVPRSRLNKVIAQRNELRKQAAGVPIKKEKEHEGNDDGEDPTTYTKEELDALLQQERTNAAKELNAFKLKQATLSKLQSEKALDPEIVYGLLDTEKLSLNDKGELQGLDDAGFAGIKENKKFLFEQVPGGTGRDGGKGDEGGDTLDAAIADVFSGYSFFEESK